jgi:hypothetical protein
MSHWRCCCGEEIPEGPWTMRYGSCAGDPSFSAPVTENLNGLLQYVEYLGEASDSGPPSTEAERVGVIGFYLVSRPIAGTYSIDSAAIRQFIADQFGFASSGSVLIGSPSDLYTTDNCVIGRLQFAGDELSGSPALSVPNMNTNGAAGTFSIPLNNATGFGFQCDGGGGGADRVSTLSSSKISTTVTTEFVSGPNTGRILRAKLGLTSQVQYPWAPSGAPGLSTTCRGELPTRNELRDALGITLQAPPRMTSRAIDGRASDAAVRRQFGGGCCGE